MARYSGSFISNASQIARVGAVDATTTRYGAIGGAIGGVIAVIVMLASGMTQRYRLEWSRTYHQQVQQ